MAPVVLIARVSFSYAGRVLAPGEQFSEDSHLTAAGLITAGHARLATRRDYQRADLQPEPETAAPEPRRRTYRRKVLTATA